MNINNTNAKILYRPNLGEVGNTVTFGPTGSGKSVYLSSFIKQAFECAWCGADLKEADTTYGNRHNKLEQFCCKSHRDASTRALNKLTLE